MLVRHRNIVATRIKYLNLFKYAFPNLNTNCMRKDNFIRVEKELFKMINLVIYRMQNVLIYAFG